MAERDERLTVVTISRVVLWLVWAWVVLDLVLLFLAFVLRLFGANPDAGFTEWVYRSVDRAMAPFRGIFEPIVLNGESVLDLLELLRRRVDFRGVGAKEIREVLELRFDRVLRREVRRELRID